MIGDELPEEDHVVRYVKPTMLDGTHVDGGAFVLRETEIGLSVSWLEVLEGDDQPTPIAEIRRLSRLSLASTGRFAKINVGQIKQYVPAAANEAGISLALTVLEAPYGRNMRI